MNYLLDHWFSTGVPRHTRVPWNFIRCVAKSSKILKIMLNSTLFVLLVCFYTWVCRRTFFTIVVCCELKKVENHCSRLFFFNGDLNEEKTFCRFFIKASKRDVFTSGDVKSSLFVDIFEKIELFVENKENLRP